MHGYRNRNYQFSGKAPRHTEMFNSFFSDGAMLSAVYLNILSEIATTLTTSLVEVQ